MTRFSPNPQLFPVIEAAILEAARVGLLVASATVTTMLSKKGTGRVYTQKGGRRHHASRPGYPPAPNFGRLRASWTIGKTVGADTTVQKVKISPTAIGFRLSSKLHYAQIDRGYGRVKPRPYLKPSLEIYQKTVPETMRVAFKRALAKALPRRRK